MMIELLAVVGAAFAIGLVQAWWGVRSTRQARR